MFVLCGIEAMCAGYFVLNDQPFTVVVAVIAMCWFWHIGHIELRKMCAYVINKEINEMVERCKTQVEAKGE